MSATATIERTFGELQVGDTIVALDGHTLPETRRYVVERPAAIVGGNFAAKLLPLFRSVVEHYLYQRQAQVLTVIPRPARKPVTRTVEGITWTKSATPNAEGGVKWTAENGRYELGTYTVGGYCDVPHPVRISKDLRRAVRDAISDGTSGRYNTDLVGAVRNWANGYYCCGNEHHDTTAWGAYDVETGEALVVPSYSTMGDVLVDAARAITTGVRGL